MTSVYDIIQKRKTSESDNQVSWGPRDKDKIDKKPKSAKSVNGDQ